MSVDAPIEGTAEEIQPDDLPQEPETARDATVTTAAIVPRPAASNEVLMPLDAGQVVEGMKAYQRLLHDLLDPTDWQQTNELEDDPQNPGRKRKKRFPKKSAYRKIARAFNLSFEVVSRSIDRDAEGHPVSAETIIRAVAPNGQYGDGDGYCSISEFTGRRANDPKLENSMRATATTRAKNRAIADLVGMGEVSAEEVDAAGGTQPDAPPFGPAADEATSRAASTALAALCGGDMEVARDRWGSIKQSCGGYLPHAAATALCFAAGPLAAPEATDVA